MLCQNIDKIWFFLAFLEKIKFGLILLNLAYFKTSFGFVHAQKPTNPGPFNSIIPHISFPFIFAIHVALSNYIPVQ